MRTASSMIGLLAAWALACEPTADVTRLRLAHGLDARHPVHLAMEHMSERLDELSGGRVQLEIYPNEQLGSERECLELLQIGSLAMTKVSAAVLESFASDFRVFGVPYLFRDEAHRFAAMDGAVGRDLLVSGVPQRLRGLAYYDSGSRSFYTVSRPLQAPDDLRGMKIRTQESATATALVRALGAAATPIAWGELYTALQQGVVDGAENNPPSFYLSRHYEVARFYTLDEHTAVPDVLLVSEGVWQRLDATQRAWVSTAAQSSEVYQRALWREATAAALTAVEDAGVQILVPDKEPFARLALAVRRDLERDDALRVWMERIEAVAP